MIGGFLTCWTQTNRRCAQRFAGAGWREVWSSSRKKPRIYLTRVYNDLKIKLNLLLILPTMSERLTGTAETERRPSRLQNVLAALGIATSLNAAPEARADAVAEAPLAPSAADTLAEDVAARLRDCAAEADGAKRTYVAEQIAANDVSAHEARAWLGAQVRKPEFVQAVRDAGMAAFNDCDDANAAVRLEAAQQRLAETRARGRELDARLAEQAEQIAALDARIAAANEVFREHGFAMREDEGGQTMLFYEGRFGEPIPAAYFVQNPETSEWSLDFTPLHEVRDAMQAETEALEADTAEKTENIRQMEERIEEIWRSIEAGEGVITVGEQEDRESTGESETTTAQRYHRTPMSGRTIQRSSVF